MGKATPWIIAGVVVIGASVAVYASMKKKSSSSNGKPPPPANTDNTGDSSNPTPSGGFNDNNAANSNPIGKSIYVARSGLIVRSSPELNDGFLGFGSNNVGAINSVGTLLGVVQGVEPDNDRDINPVTNKPYSWYRFAKDPSLSKKLLLAADNCYAREDYVTIK